MDDDGTATVGRTDRAGRLVVAQRTAQGWGAPRRVPLEGTRGRYAPWAMDAGPGGEVLVAWGARDGSLRIGRLGASSWRATEPATPSDGPRGQTLDLQVAVAADGSALVAQTLGQDAGAHGLRLLAGDAAGPMSVVSTASVDDANGCAWPSLTRGADGDGLLAWVEWPLSARGPTVRTATWRADTQTLLPAQTISGSGPFPQCDGESVALTEEGAALVAWPTADLNYDDRGVLVRRSLG